MFDESVYINGGRLLISDGILPQFIKSPLVHLVYALAYIPVQASPYWLIHSCTIGRFILFGLLWLSSYLIARELSSLFHPLIMIGFLLSSPVLTQIVTNGSDAMFAAMSGFSFWQILSFYETSKIRHLCLSSLFVALAALSRPEGVVLFIIFIPFCAFLSRSIPRVAISLVVWTIPFIVIVGLYVILYGFSTGNFDLGIAQRSYFNFEQGQGLAIESSAPNLYLEGQVKSRQLYGTADENHYSVITAIRRNPRAYFQRVVTISQKIPQAVLSVYGGWMGFVFFLMAAIGIIEILRKKRYWLLCILLFWPSYLLLNVLIAFRGNHFLSAYFILFTLAAAGISSILWNMINRRQRSFGLLAFLGFCFLGIVTNESFRGEFRTLGDSADEKAAIFRREHLEPGVRVGAYGPRNVWLAKLTHVKMNLDLRHMNSDQELSAWIVDQNLEAIYVDGALRNGEPSVWVLVERQIGHNLEVGFSSDENEVQVLLVTSTDF